MKKILLFGIMLGIGSGVLMADVYEDDIYYNPKKSTQSSKSKKSDSNYISNFSDVDVDSYNRRGQYYTTAVDTIGMTAENGEDFVYTRQIQKFYNPTIVVDNSGTLADVINNSYGNVEVVYTNGYPSFSYNYYTPYWGPSYYIGVGGWNFGWYEPGYIYGPNWWGPTWAWNWGPGWGWGPSWSWSWGPSWGWGPGWGGVLYPPVYYSYNRHGHNRVGPGAGWANNTRPNGNFNGNHPRPGGGNLTPGARPSGGSHNTTVASGVQAGGQHRQLSTVAGNKAPAAGNNNGYTIKTDGHRVSNSATKNNIGVSTNSGSSSHRSGSSYTGSSDNSYNSGSNSGSSHRSSSYNYNSGSSSRSSSHNYNSGSSSRSTSSGSFGGGRSSGGGGGGRGRHR